jgi:hypothetical protein
MVPSKLPPLVVADEGRPDDDSNMADSKWALAPLLGVVTTRPRATLKNRPKRQKNKPEAPPIEYSASVS